MKQKTTSAAKKRVKLTGSGKMMLQKAAKNHLLSSKSTRQKNVSRLGLEAPIGHRSTLSRMLNISK
jgi:large subunit ribosomal protein L35